MMEIRNRIGRRNGFTLIEVIAVLVIAAILAAVVIARGLSTADVNLQAEVDTLKSHLRYAQYLSMNSNNGNDTTITTADTLKWGISVNGSYYTLIMDVNGNQTSPYKLPNESSATHDFSPISATVATILFDEWGSPNITSLTFGGQTIAITANTGFIP